MTAIVLVDQFCSCIEHVVVISMMRLVQAAHCNELYQDSIRSVLMTEMMTSLLCM